MNFDTQARQRLETLLARHADTDDTMRLDEVQGFLAALASGPDALDIGFRLPEILGAPKLYSAEEQEEIKALAQQLEQDLRENFQAGRVPELILYPDEEGRPDYLTWCNAYLYALDVCESDWFALVDDEDFEDLLLPVMVLSGIYDEDENGQVLMHVSAAERRRMEEELPQTVLAVARYWQVWQRRPGTVRRDAPKIGRNDACPCGSGRKFKHCCGSA